MHPLVMKFAGTCHSHVKHRGFSHCMHVTQGARPGRQGWKRGPRLRPEAVRSEGAEPLAVFLVECAAPVGLFPSACSEGGWGPGLTACGQPPAMASLACIRSARSRTFLQEAWWAQQALSLSGGLNLR